MAVAFDAAVSAAPTVNQTSITWEHTIGAGDNRILLIALASGANNPITDAVAPTVDGNAATLLEFRTRDTTSGGTAWRLGIWYYLAPSTGTVTILHNKGGETQHLLGGSISYSGVDQADPFGDTGGAADGIGGGGFTDDIAAAVGGMVVDFIVQNSQATRDLVPGTNQTERIDVFSLENSAIPWLKASDEAGAATVTMSWTQSGGTVNWTHYAVALNAASEGATETTVSPATGSIQAVGLAALINAFDTITLRGTLVNEAGSPLADLTGLSCLVWYNTAPAGAPDESLSSLTTNSNGSYSFALAIGGLAFGEQVYRVIYREDPPTANNCRVHSPDYE